MSEKRPPFKEDTARVLAYLRTYMSEYHGMAPSIREMANACYMSSSQIIRHLDLLQAYGRIVREPGRARGIWLPKPEGEEDNPA